MSTTDHTSDPMADHWEALTNTREDPTMTKSETKPAALMVKDLLGAHPDGLREV